jgi:cell shape-determining protein MreC
MADVHSRMKAVKARFQTEMEDLTDEAKNAKAEFEAWEKEQDTPKTKTEEPKVETPVATQSTTNTKRS